jgi:TPR repeat protein
MSESFKQDEITSDLAEQLVMVGTRMRVNSRFPSQEDNKLALSMFEKAGELGNASGLAAAGAMYNEAPNGIVQDRIKAEECYAKAIDLAQGAPAGSALEYRAAAWAQEHGVLQSYNSDHRASSSVESFLSSRGFAQACDTGLAATEVAAPEVKGPSQ